MIVNAFDYFSFAIDVCGRSASSVELFGGSFPAACYVFATANPKSVIPACFKRESRPIRIWTPD